MSIVSRSDIVIPGNSVRLDVTFYGFDGFPKDTDIFPTITIVQPSGGVAVGPTSAGVSRIGIGQYEFIYDVGINPAIGVWRDIWQGLVDGYVIIQEPNFVIFTTQTPALNSDGYIALGDDPGFNFSQNALMNINKLMKKLRVRLNSEGFHAGVDDVGNPIYAECDIFTADQLATFLCNALDAFNEIPHFTEFTFEDTSILKIFGEVIVQHAALSALASIALLERGREFNITDNGLAFQPPTVSELLNTQYSTELQNWWDKIKEIKRNMKPSPLGVGSYFSLGATLNTSVARLRHLRARQIIF